MSLSLKHIPCPAGNKCTAFHCIFGHESDQPAAPAPPVAEVPVARKSSLRDSPADEHGPRKRVKTDAASSRNSTTSGAVTAAADNQSTKMESTTRPVSPPPLKRKTPSLAKRPTPSALDSKNPSLSSQSSPSPTAKPIKSKPKKIESLNPRLMKKSPASFEIRLRLLRMLHSEYTRLNNEVKKTAKEDEKSLVLSDQDLIVRALDKEEHIGTHRSTVYSNLLKNLVMQYKRMKVEAWKEELKEEMKEKPEDGAPEPPKKIETGLTSLQELELVRRLVTPIDDLTQHGYVPAVPSDEAIEKARQGVEASKGWEKCDRCQQRFQVFPGRREEDGALTSAGSCTFHWGKTFIAAKAPGDRSRQPKRYLCCGQDVGDSVGCYTDDHHVFKTSDPKRLALVLNFAETPQNILAPSDRAVAFDCEMGYTVYGMELIRLTATSWPAGEELLDVLVRPVGEILDLNSRYSGVWPDDLAQAESWTVDDADGSKPAKSGDGDDNTKAKKKKKLKIVSSPEVARDLLFSLISPSTPLIGHGLENDLNAVRVVHPTLVDTVLLYPHRAGLPFRYGLKHLMDVHLDRKIQQETGPKMLGHDSAEDARAAGDLVRLKIKYLWRDMQMDGWKLVDGKFVDPKKGGLTEEFIEA